MKRKKTKIIRVFPMSQPERTALWIALDLLHFVIPPHNSGINYSIVISFADSLYKMEHISKTLELTLSTDQIRTSSKALDYARQFLDGKTLYFYREGPEWERLSSELKDYEPVIRNVWNHFAAAVRELGENA